MKARILKKLSKRLIYIAPKQFADAWIDDADIAEISYEQGVRVGRIYSMGGGTDCWGEGQDALTAWEWLKNNWEWSGAFPQHPEGHEFEGYPDTSGFKPTTLNLLKLVAE